MLICKKEFFYGSFLKYRTGTALTRPTEKNCCFVFAIKSINFDVCAELFSAADRCFPRARQRPYLALLPLRLLVTLWSILPRHKGTKRFIQVVPSLRGLQTRAGTAITRPTENLCSRRSQRSHARILKVFSYLYMVKFEILSRLLLS